MRCIAPRSTFCAPRHNVATGSSAFRQIDIHFRRSYRHVAARYARQFLLRRLATSSFTTAAAVSFGFQCYPSLKDVAFHFSTLSQRIMKMAARQEQHGS